MSLPGGATERAKSANQRKITKSSPKILNQRKNNKILRFKKLTHFLVIYTLIIMKEVYAYRQLKIYIPNSVKNLLIKIIKKLHQITLNLK